MNQHPKKPAHLCDCHVWIPTASPLFERCSRAGCKAMRQLVGGVWTEPRPTNEQKAALPAQQPDLWA